MSYRAAQRRNCVIFKGGYFQVINDFVDCIVLPLLRSSLIAIGANNQNLIIAENALGGFCFLR